MFSSYYNNSHEKLHTDPISQQIAAAIGNYGYNAETNTFPSPITDFVPANPLNSPVYPWMTISRTTRPAKSKINNSDEVKLDNSDKNIVQADILDQRLKECQLKRPRTTFNSQQILHLETEFYTNK